MTATPVHPTPVASPAHTGEAPGVLHSTAEHAVQWARTGFHVFPCNPGQKTPATPRGFKDATNDPDKVAAAFAARPDFNVGLVPGASGHVVVDIDSPEAEEALRDLWGGEAPATVAWATDRGRHLLYRTPEPIRSRTGLAPGLDVKGTGGYVLVPPSVHPSGAVYSFEGGTMEVATLTEQQAAALASRTAPEPPPQDDLRAPSMERLADVVDTLPNDGPEYEDRGAYIRTACAIRAAAGPENLAEAFEMFRRWSDRWTGGAPDPDYDRATWDSLRGPYRVGYGYLVELADPSAAAALEFEAVPGAVPPPAAVGMLAQIKTGREMVEAPREPVKFVVDGILARGRMGLFAASPKAGKSTASRALAVSVVTGTRWLDAYATAAGRVLYVALEEHPDDVAEDLEALGGAVDALDIYVGPPPREPLVELRAVLEAARAERRPYSLVVLDTLFRFLRVEDGNSYADTTDALTPLIALAHESGAHILGIHHTRKGSGGANPYDAVLGSQGVWASFDVGLLYTHAKHLSDSDRVLTIRGRKHVAPSITVVRLMSGGSLVSLGSFAGIRMDTLHSRMAEIGPASVDELTDATGYGRATVDRYLDALRAAGRAERVGNGKKGDPYRWQVLEGGAEFSTSETYEDLVGEEGEEE